MKNLVYYIFLTLAVSSCIYPYDAERDGVVPERLVVSGDILIGEMSKIELGYVVPISEGAEAARRYSPTGDVVVENDKGQRFQGVNLGLGTYYIDTTDAPEKAKYRLVITLSDGREYTTPWSGVNQAPRITDLSYKVDDNMFRLYCSLSGRDSIWNFSWDYDEVWEYHAYFIPNVLWVNGAYEKRIGFKDYYYCWNRQSSIEPCLASADGLAENRIEQNNFLSMSRSDNRISYLYSIMINVRGLSAPARAYLENMRSNANGTGDLFSPTPSEMRGNISCVTDPQEQVVGYVSVCKRSSHRIFVGANGIYKMPVIPEGLLFYPEPDEDGNLNLDALFQYNSPVFFDDDDPDSSRVSWGPKRCVDCRAFGGNKTKPEWWPNDDE